MDKVTEVGQKMRSAIKAKLIELGCYVDDELPDYVMVMVANRRTKSMMTEDLQLFLGENTEVFVNWLHQVLQKLQEVTVTNIDVPKITKQEARLKRKITENKSLTIKKEKHDKEKHKKIKTEKTEKKSKKTVIPNIPSVSSITDEIPVSASKIVEKRNSINKYSGTKGPKTIISADDSFDIPSISEVNTLEDSQLTDIERKLLDAKKRLASMQSDSEDEDIINIQAEAEEFPETEFPDEMESRANNNKSKPISEKPKHKPISLTPPRDLAHKLKPAEKKALTSQINRDGNRKRSVLERLGKKPVDDKCGDGNSPKRKRICLSEIRRTEEELLGISSKKQKDNKYSDKSNNSVHKRIGSRVIPVRSKVNNDDKDIVSNNNSVPSVVQIKPRTTLPTDKQANKNLLLKAVAEAQKSVTSVPVKDDKEKIDSRHKSQLAKKELFTKQYLRNEKNKDKNEKSSLSSKLKKIIIEIPVNKNNDKQQNRSKRSYLNDDNDDSTEYIPMPLSSNAALNTESEYIPSSIELSCDSDLEKDLEYNDELDKSCEYGKQKKNEHHFIVTLNGVDSDTFKSSKKDSGILKSVKSTDDKPESKKKPEPEKKAVKRPPSPIIFNKEELAQPKVVVQPEKKAKIYPALPLKVKERCKFWPGCVQGESCEFIHPSAPCKMFPLCKFGDRCLYIHPNCKFGITCSRRDCPYAHSKVKPTVPVQVASRVVPIVHSKTSHAPAGSQQVCKYFPQCSNPQCHYHHPRPCRFGKYCINKLECNFLHSELPTKEKLTWRSSY